MHPSGHLAAQQQRCSHVPMPFRQPGAVAVAVYDSLSMHVEMVLVPCVLRSWVLCDLFMSYAG